eukprot:g2549.t1
MAHVLSKRDVNEYKDFHIPNGKILSSKDLCDLMENAASSNNRNFEWFFNMLKTISAKFREEDVIAENSDFNRKWFGGRKRKSSLVRHFRSKRNSMSGSSRSDSGLTSSASSRRRVSTSMLSVKKTMSVVPE